MTWRHKAITLPQKANKILNGVLVVLILIAVKIWHLAVVQHEKKQEESKKPQRRIVIERSERATIYDRFNIPLATNKVQYNATICYGPIRELPRWKWEKASSGKRTKRFFRKEYIAQLAQKLGDELDLDPDWLEDMIHAKAAILGNVPCIIKENISEKQYFRLQMLEKDWPGIQAEIAAKRCYPLGPIAGEVVGYIGPISRHEYDAVTREMAQLREALSAYEEGRDEALHGTIEQIRARLEELEKKAYHINDFVGKMGVEATYDEELRGLRGKNIYLADMQGAFLRELPGSEKAVPGNRLILTLSAELQAYAYQLLAEYENEPFNGISSALKRKAVIPENRPWIKGGAIVALNPQTGEVYAMASLPNFDPNDFIRSENDPESIIKNIKVNKWLENEQYLANIWDIKFPLIREYYGEGRYLEEKIDLSWKNYLTFILPKSSPVRATIEMYPTVDDALSIQHLVDQLIHLFADLEITLSPSQIFDFIYDNPESLTHVLLTLQQKEFLKERSKIFKEQLVLLKTDLERYFSLIPLNYEKLLLVDLYRVALDPSLFSPCLAKLLGSRNISEHREASVSLGFIYCAIQEIVRNIFFETDFKKWRENNFQSFLSTKRQEEKEANKKYARPYIEYLEKVKRELFDHFWHAYRWELIAFLLTGQRTCDDPHLDPYFITLNSWGEELQAGAHQGLDWVYHYHQLRTYTNLMNQDAVETFLKTLRQFEQLQRPLLGDYTGLRGNKEKDLASAFYPSYGFGLARSQAFRQATTIGSIFKLIPAYEALRQRYETLKERGESFNNLNPLTIIDDKHLTKNDIWNVGFTVDGRPIPVFYKGGRLPRSEHAGIGKIDLIRALETSSNPYFAILAGDVLEDPEDICKAAHLFGYGERTGIDLPYEYAGRLPLDVAYNRSGLYSMTIGQHTLVGTPLQTAAMLALVVNGGSALKPYVLKHQISQGKLIEHKPEVKWRVFMPLQIQNILLSGLKQVIMGEKGTARHIRHQFDSLLIKQIMGKTSTSEVIEKMSLDGNHGKLKLKHIWFGGISFESNDFTKPELVVIVYLRYGGWGKDAVPLAVEIVKKWRELKKKYAVANI